MPKIYIYAFLIVVVIGFIKWYSDRQYDAGYNAHKAEVTDAKDDAEDKDTSAVKEVIKWRDKEKVIYRDKIKYIKAAKDTTGCADTKLTDMGFSVQ